MALANPYAIGLDRNAANHVALSPLSFLERAAHVYPDRIAIVHGDLRQDWRTTYARSRRLASALSRRGVGVGHTVAAMLPNTPAMFEAHFGVPMSGAVLNTLNTRLDPEAIAFMLQHGEASVLLTDREFAPVVGKALAMLGARRPLVVEVEDLLAPPGERLGEITYEALLDEGDPAFAWQLPADEWDAIALNYTSGTTGNPKGVVTHHRGAYLNAANNVIAWSLPHHPVYLWTLPMFHCNGWCFPWTMALVAGTSVCLRRVDPAVIFPLVREHGVTHMCGAPIVYSMLINAPAGLREGIAHEVKGLIAGAAPPAAVIEGCEAAGISLTHVYGLTEVYGPAAVCAKQAAWDDLPADERARLNGRQGVTYPLQQAVTVLDPETMQPVPADGETIGEIFFRGNVVMKGYLKNPSATEEAFAGGWFHTGDLAVMHPDGYVKIKDRSKDIIISGGENISSIEVEDVLHRHPAVMLAAVVALPDAKWGEVPCAFIELKAGAQADEAGVLEFCRSQLARFKVPKRVVFGELPKTSTGKIQKFQLRARVQSASAID
ncbi:MAG: acyl-CoA synthetase [Piscinibacter sp.]|jgi:fatty-acyl-CoA synthase|uniref:Acyl-CoA synthetase n=1 Tax=Rubrivivax albus TaxID=2499835 RepID=A0A3S2UP00_9BURK|nr:acyl-CoA synthetase [Rubrivivax albus]RVT50500.1 acyl-CoA synthetase [Rubrivivax albus]HNW63289.1 acyl-CoA synthetase [Piscinibacter sp.]HPM67658.1 acyl-CoA synthetase [Piscinibacter sp.]